MFSSQPKDELVFGTPTSSQPDEILNHLISDHVLIEGNYNINLCSKSDQKQLAQTTKLEFRSTQTSTMDECNIRRVMHRDIERKRRQEMSNLYVSLRSLLPTEHIKGKRSTCDQMQEAANYIELMQKNIQELRIRRDKLKKLSNLSGKKIEGSNDSDHNLPNRVAVNLIPDGVEILFTSGVETSELGLSWMLAELLERGLHVVSCVSTKTKGRFLHKIQAQAKDMTSNDLSVMQERLSNAVN